jgi:hypothetical protein
MKSEKSSYLHFKIGNFQGGFFADGHVIFLIYVAYEAKCFKNIVDLSSYHISPN